MYKFVRTPNCSLVPPGGKVQGPDHSHHTQGEKQARPEVDNQRSGQEKEVCPVPMSNGTGKQSLPVGLCNNKSKKRVNFCQKRCLGGGMKLYTGGICTTDLQTVNGKELLLDNEESFVDLEDYDNLHAGDNDDDDSGSQSSQYDNGSESEIFLRPIIKQNNKQWINNSIYISAYDNIGCHDEKSSSHGHDAKHGKIYTHVKMGKLGRIEPSQDANLALKNLFGNDVLLTSGPCLNDFDTPTFVGPHQMFEEQINNCADAFSKDCPRDTRDCHSDGSDSGHGSVEVCYIHMYGHIWQCSRSLVLPYLVCYLSVKRPAVLYPAGDMASRTMTM